MKVTLTAKSQVATHRSRAAPPPPQKEKEWGDTPHSPRQLLHLPSDDAQDMPAGALDGSGNLQFHPSGWRDRAHVEPRDNVITVLGPPCLWHAPGGLQRPVLESNHLVAQI
jgi:hypothetical protein